MARLSPLTFPIPLPDLTSTPVEDGPSQGVPRLVPIELRQNPTPVLLVVNVREQALRNEAGDKIIVARDAGGHYVYSSSPREQPSQNLLGVFDHARVGCPAVARIVARKSLP